MPELPEVETIKRQLAEKIIGKKLQGRRVLGVRRRGKILIIDFDDGSSLIFHLKLTGQLIFQGKAGKHTRRVFNFSDGSRLIFNCVRRFGWWKEVKNTKKIEKELGPEALDIDAGVFLANLNKRPNSRVKSLLMDQKFIAGIGNIYSDEILFAAKVRPSRRIKTLSDQEAKSIFQNIKKILKAAIKKRGSSVEYYLDARGRPGGYVECHKVYHREKCIYCGAGIKKIKMGGRTAHFCPSCQK